MPRKTKIILISVFIFVIAVLLGVYFYNKSKTPNTVDPNAGFYQKFNPFGTSTKVDNGGDTTNTTTDNVDTTLKVNSRFHKLTDFAVAGATSFEDTRDEATVPSLRYVERATGHVYQMYLDTKVTGKISNSTIPGVYETIFDGKANSVIYRYASEDNKSITSFLATLGGKSSFLNSNILEVALSPDKSKFFSVIETTNGVIGVTKSFEETKTSQVFTSAFSEWLPQWATTGNIYLTTKPSYLVEGSVFNLNIANGTLSKILGRVQGLTTLANKDGTSLLYGASLDNGPRLNIFNIKNHTSEDLGKYGLPEKCVWSSDNINVYCAVPNTIVGNQYPDSWYQGVISFDDFFVKINTVTKESATLANSKDEVPVDGTNLFLNKDESKLFFINKKDSTLWSLDL
ncbi:hypothetical protein A2467_03030 [Candidatus Nomurabacteria bacterium RIFOXYC2_FULL_36_8]|nr:MAG: hypothetical protein UR97_C0006G0021 [Candidatus Nomurabacteria bacterium GW2011_GWE2_36_115]KKP93542.1 MAG: hypothetical protein US00_C0006G0022 [Candidatus Nomurabacteria bacterium GW2011_GWF2_36_126]KKP97092.1 MAG: hypothetical protein US04_C0001G0595 [Candidatus Nomurabacteria bacterium GW2011_GWD2_36_14]KKP98906.1 MAG: hypothetical protein US08_C0005G0014 [Candidatus Nomurabacteria bacterium GW2011_GWF2_36_19]KKQ05947.1 MAG: hypothetical protein US17_C0001G0125 [Candidatus Nomuraba